jgi:hypothetical protein
MLACQSSSVKHTPMRMQRAGEGLRCWRSHVVKRHAQRRARGDDVCPSDGVTVPGWCGADGGEWVCKAVQIAPV